MCTTNRSVTSSISQSITSKRENRSALAALQVFTGGTCYGAMATTYKLAYAAGFTSNQVVASQTWFGFLFFTLALLIGRIRGRRTAALSPVEMLRLMGLGALTCLTSILYCYAMSMLPAGLLIAMLVLGEPLGAIEWLGVAIILAGVCLAQLPGRMRR